MTDPKTNIGEEVKSKIINQGIAETEDVVGCTRQEIENIEETCGVTLPSSYRSFLRHLGRSSGSFLQGHTCHYPRLRKLQDRAKRAFQREGVESEFENSYFAFLGSQSVVFYYFDTEGGRSDPPVYVLAEGRESPERYFDSYSEWLHSQIEEHAEVF